MNLYYLFIFIIDNITNITNISENISNTFRNKPCILIGIPNIPNNSISCIISTIFIIL